jgi:hypothetical protein
MLSIIVRRFGDSLAGVWLLAAVLRSEVYAFEQQYLHEEPPRELKLQAIRIGDLGIAALPDEAFGITGLKLKQSSLQSLLGAYRSHVSHAVSGRCDFCRAVCEMLAFPEFCGYLPAK